MSNSTSAEEFQINAEKGLVPMTCHDDVLRIAYIYGVLDEDGGIWNGNGVFDVVERLHAHGWSFGEGNLRFNRTLDIFYLSQLAAAIYRYSNQLEEDFPSWSDFPEFYTAHHGLLHASAWRSYYSAKFLAQSTTARFYRPPDLQDLPDLSFPLGQSRSSLSTQVLKVPAWARTVSYARHMQPFLPFETFVAVALTTLEKAMTHLHEAYPDARPYSESHACFWLNRFGLPTSSANLDKMAKNVETWRPRKTWRPHFGISVAQGWLDIHMEEAKYRAQIGEVNPGDGNLEPVMGCGFPDGGTGVQAWQMGWQEEVGSEEEVGFLAAVAVEETVGLGLQVALDELDLSVRSHILLAVMQAAVKIEQEREIFLEELEMQMLRKGSISEERAARWIQEVLEIIEPYVRVWQGVWPGEKERGEMLRLILVENPLLFGYWKVSPPLEQMDFSLGLSE